MYLRRESAITRVNLRNHSYRDVTYSPVEEFDSSSLDASQQTLAKERANLWICGASGRSIRTDGSEWCRDVIDEAYMPAPFDSDAFEPTEWPHCLAAIDVSALPRPTKFCDPDGYDIIPIRMIQLIEPKLEDPKMSYETKGRHRREEDVSAIVTIHMGEEEDDFVDPFHIQIRMHTQQVAFRASALIDSGADCNVMSYAVWNA